MMMESFTSETSTSNESGGPTVVSHFFNEEYLLPFWLEHHSKIFDHGIMIDYCSTDKSASIIRKFCPHWEIVKTVNVNPDGSPNFEARLVDLEVMEIEKRVQGFKMCLNTTEYLFCQTDINKLSPDVLYKIPSFAVMSHKEDFYPNNYSEFLNGIELIKNFNNSGRGHRYMHAQKVKYETGRHIITTNEHVVIPDGLYIIWCGLYPHNKEMFKRRLQIQNNIPLSDIQSSLGSHHIKCYKEMVGFYHDYINEGCVPLSEFSVFDAVQLFQRGTSTQHLYSELVVSSDWGQDNILLKNDDNLLNQCSCNDVGYTLFPHDETQKDIVPMLSLFLQDHIEQIVHRKVNLENYHNEITDTEHTLILKAMPFKKEALSEIGNYLETIVSRHTGHTVKIFNGDLWFRICRPSSISNQDYNPCHRDIYLDFYRNVVNIYLPVIGSDERSSLALEPGSHLWNEKETRVTKGGAYFKYAQKKYSVDAIVSSKIPLNMICPNPSTNEVLLFSPYLIHGCSKNGNKDRTRISLEVRFIRDNDNGLKQEAEMNAFLKTQDWR